MSAFYFCVNSRHDITKLRMTSLALPTAIFLGRVIVKYLMRETENLNITKPRSSAGIHQFCKSLQVQFQVAPRQFYWVTTIHCYVSICRATNKQTDQLLLWKFNPRSRKGFFFSGWHKRFFAKWFIGARRQKNSARTWWCLSTRIKRLMPKSFEISYVIKLMVAL